MSIRIRLPEFYPILKEFLPKELYDACFDEEKSSLDTSKLPEWFGDRVELVTNARKFSTFPGCDTFFGIKLTSPYTTSPKPLKSLKKTEYVYKHDILIALQGIHTRSNFSSWAADLAWRTIGYFLKCEEASLSGRFELVKYPKKEIIAFAKSLKCQAELPLANRKMLSFKQHFENWKSILPAHKDDPEYQAVYEMLKDASQYWKSIKDSHTCEEVVLWCKSVIKSIKTDMQQKPEWFVSTSESQSTKVIIRLFEDEKMGNKKTRFIFFRELLNSMKRVGMDVSALEEEYKNSDEFATIDFNEAHSKLGGLMSEMEFVIVPIIRTLRRVTYIPTWDGKYCVPVADVLIEILDDLMRGKHILQLTNVNNFEEVFSIFESFEDLFGRKLNKMSFIDVKHAKSIKKRIDVHFDNYISSLPEHKRKVRPLKKTTREGDYQAGMLESELDYTGIGKNYPFSLELAHQFYRKLVTVSKENARTFESSFGIVSIETVIIQNSLANFSKFMHFQQACHRMDIPCECMKMKNPWGQEYVEHQKIHVKDEVEENQEMSVFEEQVDEESEQDSEEGSSEDEFDCGPNRFFELTRQERSFCKTVYKIQVLGRSKALEVRQYAAKNCVCGFSKFCLHCSKSAEKTEEKKVDEEGPSTPLEESEKQIKKREKRRRQANRRKMEKEEQQKAPQQESKVCEKCIRTSNYCMEANAKLKEEKITTKALKKELKEKDVALLEKDQQLEKKDQKILELEEMVAQLQLQIAQRLPPVAEKPSSYVTRACSVVADEPSTSIDNPTTPEKPEDQPSTSSSPEEDFQVRYLTPTYRYSEHTPEMREKLHEFIAIRDFLPGSWYEVTDLTRKFIRKTTNPSLQAMAKRERRQFGEVYEKYLEAINSNIEWIRNNKEKTVEDIPSLPEFPVLSDRFYADYRKVFDEINDSECLICLTDMKIESESIKCDGCKRRLHTKCASDWYKVKKECPVCEKKVESE